MNSVEHYYNVSTDVVITITILKSDYHKYLQKWDNIKIML